MSEIVHQPWVIGDQIQRHTTPLIAWSIRPKCEQASAIVETIAPGAGQRHGRWAIGPGFPPYHRCFRCPRPRGNRHASPNFANDPHDVLVERDRVTAIFNLWGDRGALAASASVNGRFRASLRCNTSLALLWQIYSRRCSLQIHFRQCGHRCGGSAAKSSRMGGARRAKLAEAGAR
jgi:hypothetical protein